MSWYPCCCSGRYIYLPCCYTGIVLSIVGHADGAVRDASITLSKRVTLDDDLASVDHGLHLHFLSTDAGQSLGGRDYYYFDLDPVTLDDIFTAKPGYNWKVDLTFKNTDLDNPAELFLNIVRLEFSFLNGSEREGEVLLLPASYTAPGWGNPDNLLAGSGYANFAFDPCEEATLTLFYPAADWQESYYHITEKTAQQLVAWQIPKLSDPLETENLCLQRYKKTTEAVSSLRNFIPITGCADPICLTECSCEDLRQNPQTCPACNLVSGLNFRTGSPYPRKREIEFVDSDEWTVYCYCKQDVDNYPQHMIWAGLDCWGATDAEQAFTLFRTTEGDWTLRVHASKFAWTDIGVTLQIPQGEWFFWAIRKKNANGGLKEYTLQINGQREKLELQALPQINHTLLGIYGGVTGIPASLTDIDGFYGCWSGFTATQTAASDSFLDGLANSVP